MRSSLVGADFIVRAPVAELTDFSEMAPNAARKRKPRIELPEMDQGLYSGFSQLLVRTALVRADTWRQGSPRPVIHNDRSIAMLCRHLAAADQEHLVVLAVNNTNEVVAIHEAAIGGTSSTGVECQHILKVCVLTSSPRVVIVHNHPSGNPQPSREDVTMFAVVELAARALSLSALDSVIVARDGWASISFGEVESWEGVPSPMNEDVSMLYKGMKRQLSALVPFMDFA